jgi:SAM-dependent methyltransferase
MSMSVTDIAVDKTRSADDEIRSRSCPNCYFCKAVGTLLYEGLTDRLFDAPGCWNLKRCPNMSCGLVWLDPMPIEFDIAKAYEGYYTHEPELNEHFVSREPRINKIKAGLASFYEFFWRLTPLYWEQRKLDFMYLGGRMPGRVLEVGCGNGHRLAQLRALGWDIQGQEVDEKAAAVARRRLGGHVSLGSLDQAGFQDDEFDAVVMSHVLEHVHDPQGLLGECKRVLRPGGRLVSVTPNAHAWGHSRFGARWYGLDPPRHLILYSRSTLEQLAANCGLRNVRTWTTAARSHWILGGSLRIEYGEARDMWAVIKRGVRQATLHAGAIAARVRDPDSGEECVLLASK